MTDLIKDHMYERRVNPVKTECLKIDTFTSINNSLSKIESKLDELSDEMRIMVRLEERVINQNNELTRINTIVDTLRAGAAEMGARMLELRNNFENQRRSIGTFERIIWGAATCAAVVLGKYMGFN